MTSQNTVPISLKIIAALFFISGVSTLINMIYLLFHHHINFNFSVLGIFVGWGLIKLKSGWRICALLFTWFALIGTPIAAAMVLGAAGPIPIAIAGMPSSTARFWALLILGIIFAFAIWQYRVLTSAKIKALFH